MQKKRITLYLGEDSYYQLKFYAVSQREPVSQIIDGWIQGFLAKNKYGTNPRLEKDIVPQTKMVEKMVETFKKTNQCSHLIMIGGKCNPCGGIAK